MDEKRLNEVRNAYREQKQLQEKIMEFESMRVSPRGTAYGTERVQTSARGDVQADNLVRIDELLAHYNERLRRCVDLIREFEKALDLLNGRERYIMRLYYIDGKTWEAVCVDAHVSWAHLHRIRNQIKEKIK